MMVYFENHLVCLYGLGVMTLLPSNNVIIKHCLI